MCVMYLIPWNTGFIIEFILATNIIEDYIICDDKL